MNRTLLGKLWQPIAKWFTILEMRFHLDIFRQQGLTPEDRLLHIDKTLRRNVLFEHIARETYIQNDAASTPTTGFSRRAEEKDSAGSTSQRLDTSSPSMSSPRPSSRPMSISCVSSQNGRTTSITTTIPI